METVVHLFGSLRRLSRPDTPGQTRVRLPAGSDIRDLLRRMQIEEKIVMASAVNGRACTLEKKIMETDEVYLITQLGGA